MYGQKVYLSTVLCHFNYVQSDITIEVLINSLSTKRLSTAQLASWSPGGSQPCVGEWSSWIPVFASGCMFSYHELRAFFFLFLSPIIIDSIVAHDS